MEANIIIGALIGVAGAVVGVVLGFVLSHWEQNRKKNEEKKELADFIRAEIELNVHLIRLFKSNPDNFKGYFVTTVMEIKPFKVFNSRAFGKLPILGYELSTEIRAFYVLTKMKFKSLEKFEDEKYSHVIEIVRNLEKYPKIDKDWKEGWQDLEKKGEEIVEKLKRI